jgi:Gas vesicle synthesis protein GvpL/GvpF
MTDEQQASSQGPGTYVYGIVRAGASLDPIDAVEDGLPEVRLVEAGDLAALVSESPDQATRDLVLGHGRVLEAALESSPVVPLRFGFVVTDEDAVRNEILDAHHDELARLLERLEGRVQVVLKVYYQEEVVLREVLASDPKLVELRESIQGRSEDEARNERIKLGELINNAIEKRKKGDGQEILDRLKPLAESVSLEAPEDELMVGHVVFLLPRDRIDQFDSTLEEIAQERAELMRFRLLGPMPAYNFIDVEGSK